MKKIFAFTVMLSLIALPAFADYYYQPEPSSTTIINNIHNESGYDDNFKLYAGAEAPVLPPKWRDGRWFDDVRAYYRVDTLDPSDAGSHEIGVTVHTDPYKWFNKEVA